MYKTTSDGNYKGLLCYDDCKVTRTQHYIVYYILSCTVYKYQWLRASKHITIGTSINPFMILKCASVMNEWGTFCCFLSFFFSMSDSYKLSSWIACEYIAPNGSLSTLYQNSNIVIQITSCTEMPLRKHCPVKSFFRSHCTHSAHTVLTKSVVEYFSSVSDCLHLYLLFGFRFWFPLLPSYYLFQSLVFNASAPRSHPLLIPGSGWFLYWL